MLLRYASEKHNTENVYVNIEVRLHYNCSEIKFQAVCIESARVQGLLCVRSVEILVFLVGCNRDGRSAVIIALFKLCDLVI